jgi:hypothetical protein
MSSNFVEKSNKPIVILPSCRLASLSMASSIPLESGSASGTVFVCERPVNGTLGADGILEAW